MSGKVFKEALSLCEKNETEERSVAIQEKNWKQEYERIFERG